MMCFNSSPLEMVVSFWRHHHVIKSLTQRGVLGCYIGFILGIFLSFFALLTMLTVYPFVISVVFELRRGAGEGQLKVVFFVKYFVLVFLGKVDLFLVKIPETLKTNSSMAIEEIVFRVIRIHKSLLDSIMVSTKCV